MISWWYHSQHVLGAIRSWPLLSKPSFWITRRETTPDGKGGYASKKIQTLIWDPPQGDYTRQRGQEVLPKCMVGAREGALTSALHTHRPYIISLAQYRLWLLLVAGCGCCWAWQKTWQKTFARKQLPEMCYGHAIDKWPENLLLPETLARKCLSAFPVTGRCHWVVLTLFNLLSATTIQQFQMVAAF